jgi:transposase
MPPTRPQLASAAAAETRFQTWDEILAEVNEGVEDYRLPISPDEVLVIPCPSGDQMQAFGDATRNMDDTAAAVAIFGKHAPRILELTGGEKFYARAKLLAKVMQHYSIQAGLQAPE